MTEDIIIQSIIASGITCGITILVGRFYNRRLRKVIKQMDDEAKAEIEKMRR